MPVTQGCHWQVQFPFVVALTEELLADLEAPLAADLPGSAGVGNVSAFESDLQHQMPMFLLSHVKSVGVHMTLERKK